MLLYTNATTQRDDAGFHLEVDAKLLCDFKHVSKCTARKSDGVIDSIEYYAPDPANERRSWGPFCTLEYELPQALTGAGVFFFLVNAKIAFVDDCDDFPACLADIAAIPKSRCNLPEHQSQCRLNTSLYRAFQRRDTVHCFFYPVESPRLVTALLVDILKPAWNPQ